ncbi:MAG: hypothetical protein KDC38_09865 [Planctomycetes bacterium]|nr:hypothetical protein [Planctomycetota bacterium]
MRTFKVLGLVLVVLVLASVTSNVARAQVSIGGIGGIGVEPVGPECGEPDDPIGSCEVIPNKELMITDLCVVEDPCRSKWNGGLCTVNSQGAWTFGKLMASIAGFSSINEDPQALSQFTVSWLKQILTTHDVNGFDVLGRSGMDAFLDNWAIVSGFSSWEDPDLVLDMTLAPFRLLAIVARMDLRKAPSGYSGGSAGEGRFVFGMLGINPQFPNNPDQWFSLSGTVILEYSLPATTCEDVVEWADRWHALGSIPFGPSYNAALQEITDDFAGFDAAPDRPNGSSISQVRTNEIAFSGPWELREFRLVPSPLTVVGPVPLTQVAVAQTPDIKFNTTEADVLTKYLDENETAILNGTHEIPLVFKDKPFRAGSALVPSTQFFWSNDPFNCTETRHLFALNTCNGCHARETNTQFLQVFPRSIGSESGLSTFLTGDPFGVTDPTCPQPPDDGAVIRFFHDLERRALDLCDILEMGCTDFDQDAEADMFSTPHLSTAVH